MKRLLLLLLVPALLAAFTLTSDTSYSKGPPAKVLPEYMALGDSLGVGVGASDPATKGYVPRFRDFLQSNQGLGTDVFLNNLSVSGAKSSDLLEKKGQLSQAVKELKQRNGDKKPGNDVEVVTVNIGGNDVFALVPVLLAEPACALGPTLACLTAIAPVIGGTFATFEDNFDSILGQLRTAAGPDTPIIVMTYYNPLLPPCPLAPLAAFGDIVLEGLPGLEPFGLGPLDGLNDRIEAIAATHGAGVADTFGELSASDLVGDCLHANDDGYGSIAAKFKAAFKD